MTDGQHFIDITGAVQGEQVAAGLGPAEKKWK